MNFLAIDTSANFLSLALQYNGEQTFLLELVGNKQSSFIIPKIQELLMQTNISINEIDAIAYNQGPGSFTGLRIGLSVALGIANGLNIQIIPIPAFSIYAQSIRSKTQCNKVLVGLDARLKQMYVAGVELTHFNYFIQPQVIAPALIETNENSIVCIGNGFREYYDLLPANIQQLEILDIEYPNALNMLQLINSGIYKPIPTLNADLFYLRNKVALTSLEQSQLKHK